MSESMCIAYRVSINLVLLQDLSPSSVNGFYALPAWHLSYFNDPKYT